MRVGFKRPNWDSLKTWHFETVKYLATSAVVNKSFSRGIVKSCDLTIVEGVLLADCVLFLCVIVKLLFTF